MNSLVDNRLEYTHKVFNEVYETSIELCKHIADKINDVTTNIINLALGEDMKASELFMSIDID